MKAVRLTSKSAPRPTRAFIDAKYLASHALAKSAECGLFCPETAQVYHVNHPSSHGAAQLHPQALVLKTRPRFNAFRCFESHHRSFSLPLLHFCSNLNQLRDDGVTNQLQYCHQGHLEVPLEAHVPVFNCQAMFGKPVQYNAFHQTDRPSRLSRNTCEGRELWKHSTTLDHRGSQEN